jgi:hypothetical protein
MLRSLKPIEPIDYLVIGHVTQDVTPQGFNLGGTASYSALTARAFGLRVGVVTACSPDLVLPELKGISVLAYPSEYSTTFENIQTPTGRIQRLHHLADTLDLSMVPETWRNTPIVHLGPVSREVDPNLARAFPNSLLAVTPQGWMRQWDKQGHVSYSDWPEANFVLENAAAAVISIEDVQRNEAVIEDMLSSIRVLVVTEGSFGSRLYWNGDMRHFSAPKVEEIDPTGAGDIFSTAFFIRYHFTHDPWESARFATQLASTSVLRGGLQGVPTSLEVQDRMTEILPKY